MTLTLRRCAALLFCAGLSAVAVPQPRPQDTRLPSGKLQSDEILKAEHEANIKDAAQLAALAAEVKEDIEKSDRFVVSMATIKKTDEIEKLAKRIRSRLRRY